MMLCLRMVLIGTKLIIQRMLWGRKRSKFIVQSLKFKVSELHSESLSRILRERGERERGNLSDLRRFSVTCSPSHKNSDQPQHQKNPFLPI